MCVGHKTNTQHQFILDMILDKLNLCSQTEFGNENKKYKDRFRNKFGMTVRGFRMTKTGFLNKSITKFWKQSN